MKALLLFLVLTGTCLLNSCNINDPSPMKSPVPDAIHIPAINDLKDENFSADSLTIEELQQLILGEWEWMYTKIMDRGTPPPYNIITPRIAGYKMHRIFKPDSTVEYYIDSTLTDVFKYRIRKSRVLPTDPFHNLITIGNYTFLLKFFHRNYMMYGNGYVDGTDLHFLRK